jgi:hypothetical protein
MIFHRYSQIFHCLTIKKNGIFNRPEIVFEFNGITGCVIHLITPENIIPQSVV